MLRELWSDVRYRLRALFRRGALEQDLDAELRFHLERQVEEFERRGMPRGEALRQARLVFGGIEQTKEQSRDVRGTALLEALFQDARYAMRSLRKEPIFTLAVVLVLAVGIGANTATFTVLNALLLRALPVPHPEDLVTIGDPDAVGSGWHGSPVVEYTSYPVYLDIRDHNHVLSDLYAAGAVYDSPDVIARGAGTGGGPAVEHPTMRFVTGNFFSVLQVPAFIGRTFTPAEEKGPGSDPVVVISYGYWQRRFANDPSAVGGELTVNGVPLTIVGVTPPGFGGDVVGKAVDAWIPMMMEPSIAPKLKVLDDREWSWLQMMGRRAPGVTMAQARSAIAAIETQSIRGHISGRILEEFENDLKEGPIRVEPGARGFSRYRESYGPALTILMAAVGLIILIVCANVANLMLVRGVARGREMTVRMTLGAGRGRLIRQLLTESLLLAAIGGALGLVAADVGSRVLLRIASADGTAIPLDIAPDARVLGFTAGVTLLSALFFGLLPAARATRVELATALRAQGRHLVGTHARLGRFALGKALVVVQIGLSAVLLIGAGLLLRSMQRILTADLGMDRDHLLLLGVDVSKAGYEGARVPVLMQDLADRARRVPGVLDASYAMHGLYTGGNSGMHVAVPGFTSSTQADRQVAYNAVGPGYFRTIGAQLLRGRDIDGHDVASAPKVAVINESAAKRYFAGQDPIGRTFSDEDDETARYTVVGVVQDTLDRNVRAKPLRTVYFSLPQWRDKLRGLDLTVRVGGSPPKWIPAVRDAVLAADRKLDIDVRPLDDLIRRSVADDALTTRVTAFFGVVALMLAALGLYGVTAYATSQRTGEFGLRVALGAEPASVTRMILREALALAALGVALGLPAGFAATRLIRGRIFGITPFDPASWSTVVIILVATALVASYLPARRAARVAPLDALRTE